MQHREPPARPMAEWDDSTRNRCVVQYDRAMDVQDPAQRSEYLAEWLDFWGAALVDSIRLNNLRHGRGAGWI